MPQIEMGITLSGPFFRGSPSGAIDTALKDTIREIVAEGEVDIKEQLYPGHGLLTGHYRRSIHGEMLNSRNGTIHDSKVVYGPWLEGTGSRNRTSRFKGYHMFRLAFQGLQRKAPGMLQKHIARAVKGLN